MSQLPREAREGLARVWLALLREQHPGITWVIANDTTGDDNNPGDREAGPTASHTG